MDTRNVDVDYCGIVMMLRLLVQRGVCTKKEAKNIAAKVADRLGCSIIFPSDFCCI